MSFSHQLDIGENKHYTFIIMLNTISAKQIQQGYTKIFEKANKENKPLVVVTNNKPIGAIISLKLLDKLEKIETNQKLDMLVKEAMAEYKAGKTRSISTPKELEAYFKEIEEEAMK